MNVESSFSQIAPLVFDGESYDLWKVKMKSYTESFDLWNDVEEDYEVSLLPENQEGEGKYMPICWYATDYGMFRFCIADTEHDWREGSEQYKFIEHCLATVDRQKQPWLIFAAHRVLGYSSDFWYGVEGSFEEPVGRESLQRDFGRNIK
ncbi:putative inactive purple acid phosphatase 1 isoform B [Glycine soja]|uniref:Putative inactive purple acid phosphatase 1 isoform A n=2 Tax=Glycine soja TaxID=3848 RepID=A0A445G654_GLYSO|nr:putative inactive purple acid phosphatase 1 isoform A [Glycine soja]RZB56668.1 putative inactive purple acid phosphatase 1 isoform B [Glycine soja]